MTDEELAAIEARAKAATEGPWKACGIGFDGKCFAIIHEDEDGQDWVPIAYMSDSRGDGEVADREENEAFICHARSDVPELVAEIRKLSDGSRWIPVTDHLPDPNGVYVLVTTVESSVRMVWYSRDGWDNDVEIAAWMPKPRPAIVESHSPDKTRDTQAEAGMRLSLRGLYCGSTYVEFDNRVLPANWRQIAAELKLVVEEEPMRGVCGSVTFRRVPKPAE